MRTKSPYSRVLTIMWLLGDIFWLESAFALAYYIRISSGLLFFAEEPDVHGYILWGIYAALVYPVIFYVVGLYNADYLLEGPQEYSKILSSCTFGVFALSVLAFWGRPMLASRGWLLLAWVFSGLFVGLWRFSVRRIISWQRVKGNFVSRAVIAGVGEEAVALAEQLNGSLCSGIRVVGFVDDYVPTGTCVHRNLQVLGSPVALSSIMKKAQATELIVIPRALSWESYHEIIQGVFTNPNSYKVKVSPGIYEMAATGINVVHEGFIPLMTIDELRASGIHRWLKLAIDYTVATSLLILLAPAMAVIALILKTGRSRSVIIRNRALSSRGAQFNTYTFRCSDGLLGWQDKEGTVSEKDRLPNRLCHHLEHWLYVTGFSKLPQLLSVLQGKMSLVGPRQISVDDRNRHKRWLPSLLTTKPGVTGPWVLGGGKRLTLDEEMKLNLFYIRNHTVWLDISVLAQTVVVALGAKRDTIKAKWSSPDEPKS